VTPFVKKSAFDKETWDLPLPEKSNPIVIRRSTVLWMSELEKSVLDILVLDGRAQVVDDEVKG
jgi:hypothetical protein